MVVIVRVALLVASDLTFENATLTHFGTRVEAAAADDGLGARGVESEPAAFIAVMRSSGGPRPANPFFAADPPPPAYVLLRL